MLDKNPSTRATLDEIKSDQLEVDDAVRHRANVLNQRRQDSLELTPAQIQTLSRDRHRRSTAPTEVHTQQSFFQLAQSRIRALQKSNRRSMSLERVDAFG